MRNSCSPSSKVHLSFMILLRAFIYSFLVKNDIPLENSTASAPDLLNYQSHGNGITPKIVEQVQMVP